MGDSSTPRFELSGRSLALDFANTWEDRGRPETDKLRTCGDLLAFAEQAGILDRREAAVLAGRAAAHPAAAAKTLAGAIALRETLYRIFAGRASDGNAETADLERLAAAYARGARLLRLEPDRGGFAWRWQGMENSLEAVLAPVARSAAELLTGDELERVRECDGTRCTWLFLDTSRNRSRRWCSMESCGNRAKARRHYRRSRAAGGPG